VQAAGVVGVQVGDDDAAHVTRREAEALELRPDLLLGPHPFADPEPEVGMPAWEVAALGGAGGLARVDEDEPFVVLDEPGMDGQRLGPVPVEHGDDQSRRAAAATVALAFLDGDGAGLDGVDAHGVLPTWGR
jgi:hypothetical protein